VKKTRKPKNNLYYRCSECGHKEPVVLVPGAGETLVAKTGCCNCEEEAILYRNGKPAPASKYGEAILYRKAKDFGQGKTREAGVWMSRIDKSGLSIYVTCFGCGGVNDITNVRISPCGNCQCFYCAQCGADLIVCLDGWKRYDRPNRASRRGVGEVAEGVYVYC